MTALAPVVAWNQSGQQDHAQDRWSRTYVSRAEPPNRRHVPSHSTGESSKNNRSSPVKRFPRPMSSSSMRGIEADSRVSAHINSATSLTSRPPSPLKQVTNAPKPEANILPSLSPNDTSSLAKVYGSLLQPKETLEKHSCTICFSVFPPDATIYPDPRVNDPQTPKFLCRPCFETHGGSKGVCPSCKRPVLALRSEGGYVTVTGSVWHKRCFVCNGCSRNIGDCPMVDLLGRPSCSDCFDSCLMKERTPRKTSTSSFSPNTNTSTVNTKRDDNFIWKSRESSPTIDELESRLGITRTREMSPELDELTHRLRVFERDRLTASPSPVASPKGRSSSVLSSPSSYSASKSSQRVSSYSDSVNLGLASPSKTSGSPSLTSSLRYVGSTRHVDTTDDAIDEMKRRFMRSLSSQPASLQHSPSLGSLSSLNINSFGSHCPPTPDMMSDVSDTTTISSLQSDLLPKEIGNQPISISPGQKDRFEGSFFEAPARSLREDNYSEQLLLDHPSRRQASPYIESSDTSLTAKPQLTGQRVIDNALRCKKCLQYLFIKEQNINFVAVSSKGDEQDFFHSQCFICYMCQKPFNTKSNGQAIFVEHNDKPYHPMVSLSSPW
jgi:hypothetical protein